MLIVAIIHTLLIGYLFYWLKFKLIPYVSFQLQAAYINAIQEEPKPIVRRGKGSKFWSKRPKYQITAQELQTMLQPSTSQPPPTYPQTLYPCIKAS
jgi:hypothetical protein